MKRITEYEYDKEGRLVKETVTEHIDNIGQWWEPPPTQPLVGDFPPYETWTCKDTSDTTGCAPDWSFDLPDFKWQRCKS